MSYLDLIKVSLATIILSQSVSYSRAVSSSAAFTGDIVIEPRIYAALAKTGAPPYPPNTPPLIMVRTRPEWHINFFKFYPGKVQWSKVNQSPIPDTVNRSNYLLHNCTKDAQGFQKTLSVTYQEGTSTTVTHSITNTASAKFTIPFDLFSADLGVSTSINAGESTTTNSVKTVKEDEPTAVNAPPYTDRLYSLEKRQSAGYLEFKGDVIVDAKLFIILRVIDNGEVYPSDPYNVGDVSDRLSEKERTLLVEGNMWNVTVQDTTHSWTDSPLDPKTCSPTEKATFEGEAGKPLLFRRNSSSSTGRSAPQLVDSPLDDGMTITTADVVGSIEVRAKSLGPGFCATTIRSATGSAGILAPPGFWSGWSVIDSHIGVVDKTYHTDIQCDTGAMFEIRYWK